MASEALWAGIAGAADAAKGYIDERIKNEIADRLEQQREQRAEERQKAREQRQAEREASKVVEWEDVQDGNRWYQRGYNSSGDAIQTRDIPANRIAEIVAGQRAAEADARYREGQIAAQEAGLRSQSLMDRLRELQIGNFGAEAAERRALNQARIGTERARQQELLSRGRGERASGRRGEDSGQATTLMEAADSLIEESRTLLDDYNLTAAEETELARRAFVDATRTGRDPRDLLRRYLAAEQANPGSITSSPSSRESFNPR